MGHEAAAAALQEITSIVEPAPAAKQPEPPAPASTPEDPRQREGEALLAAMRRDLPDLFANLAPPGDAHERVGDLPGAEELGGQEATALATRHDELRHEGRTLRAQAAADSDARVQVAEEHRNALAQQRFSGDAAARVKAAEKALVKLDAAASERETELQIVTDATALAEREVGEHARQNAKALWAELEKASTPVARRLVEAIEALTQARAEFVVAGQRATELLRLTNPASLRTERIPAAVGDFVKRHAAEAARAVRVPLPGQSPVISIVNPPVDAEETVSP
jgi:hypothetical protein